MAKRQNPAEDQLRERAAALGVDRRDALDALGELVDAAEIAAYRLRLEFLYLNGDVPVDATPELVKQAADEMLSGVADQLARLASGARAALTALEQ